MNSAAFLSAVKAEIARLQQIQDLLENESIDTNVRSSTRPTPGSRKGGMTAEGRARVAEAQRKRWAAKRDAAETVATSAPATAKKKTAAPAKKAAKTAAPVPPAKKLAASATKAVANKAAVPAKKVLAKKSAPAAKPTAAKKPSTAKKPGSQAAPKKSVRNVPRQPESNARAEVTEANAPVLDVVPAVPEATVSNE